MEEREKIAVSALLEDFKARWQELLNFEAENSRWSTLYVTALILSISWYVNNDHYVSLSDLFNRKENGYFIVSLALVNAVYTLAMAMKGYQIQQIGLYLYTEIGQKVTSLTHVPFNSWERWRREAFHSDERKGKPELVRMIYYPIIGALPAAVSLAILILYLVHAWNQRPWYNFRNLYFYVVSLLVVASAIAAIWTLGINNRWEEVLAESSHK